MSKGGVYMEQETKKRVRRSAEEITKEKIQRLEADIKKYEDKVSDLKKQLDGLVNPSVKMKDIKDRILELNLPLDEVMKTIDKMGKK